MRRPEELAGVDGLVLPGGESTTIVKLADRFGLLEPLRAAVREGLPVYGSCAGMILLADRILDAPPDQETIGGLDVTVRRNAFGRQVDSFEADLDMAGLDGGPAARGLHPGAVGGGGRRRTSRSSAGSSGGAADGKIVAVRQGNLVATSFHPELTGDRRVHALFVDIVRRHLAEQCRRAPGTRGASHERPFQVGDDEAQEGRHRRQARQALRQADQEHRGRGPHRRR